MHTPLSFSGVISIMFLQGIFTLFLKRLFFIFFNRVIFTFIQIILMNLLFKIRIFSYSGIVKIERVGGNVTYYETKLPSLIHFCQSF